jgi:predicted Fe-Mo cluster-binding NifX family protein
LDPVLHAGYGGVGKTQKFLDAVLRWVRGEFGSGGLIAVGTDETGKMWSDHFGIAPYYLLFDDTGTCVERRCNPYATQADGTAKHHGNPRFIIELLTGCVTWIGKYIGKGGDARRSMVEQAGIEIVPTESENTIEAVQTYLTAHRENV